MAKKPKNKILQPLHQSTWPIMQKSFAKHGFSATDILTNWRAIIGDELAERAVPHRISWPKSSASQSFSTYTERSNKGGTLIVQAQDGPSAVEIQYLELEIVERINVFYGYSAITRLKVIQGAPNLCHPKRPIKKKALSDEQNRHLDNLNQTDLDESLSKALYRLGEQIYGQSK